MTLFYIECVLLNDFIKRSERGYHSDAFRLLKKVLNMRR